MAHFSLPSVAVLLPGTGSDADFASRAFHGPLTSIGVEVVAVDPAPGRLVEGYLDALDDAHARHGRLVVGGVSIGAAVAVQWALHGPDRAAAVLAAMPAWTGDPSEAPAAAGARYTADRLRGDGLDRTIAAMRATSPAWLADELTRSWTAQWPHLPESMEQAAAHHSPTLGQLTGLTTPVAIAAAVDDPLHPIEVARDWDRALPCSAVETVRLDEIGADPSVLGRACLTALDRLPVRAG
ncbi:alpha/beta hydrolase [Rhodococcus sp. D2-41]|uniref:Alpha/beta hydrolase n=1 Tax=Speluncibacter jeojiensis TaxID=2710754 RepID=A0A9X4M4C7_9ACTN|nr:alpha/beta hydrolase [Rhodococcus sp. D2-41]MDG3011399.1 alpha/beta hydrolase [Rhodococcus sp. D2-41]MDG3016589.1 alpha/beta hydrolase [Corynebacteriales bacterium D3-21]